MKNIRTSLVRYAHTLDVASFEFAVLLQLFHRLFNALDTGIVEVLRVLLHPSLLRIDLLEFLLVRGNYIGLLVEDVESAGSGPAIQRAASKGQRTKQRASDAVLPRSFCTGKRTR